MENGSAWGQDEGNGERLKWRLVFVGLHVTRFYLIFYFSICLLVCSGGSGQGRWGLKEDKDR